MTKSVAIKSSGIRRLRAGGLWVYANEVQARLADFENGEVVRLVAPDGTGEGLAYAEPHSLIALRVLRRDEGPIDRGFFRSRLAAADVARRRYIQGEVYRSVFSEADRLPGLIVDRYGRVLSVQILTWGMERLKGAVVDALREVYRPDALILRNDNDVRRGLGLATEDELMVFSSGVDFARHEIELLGLSLVVDFETAQKTGLYLDQVGTYRTVGGIDFTGLSGCDLFCYSGIFGMLALRHGAQRVTFVDSSEPTLAILAENLERNRMPAERYDIVRSDVLSYLDRCAVESNGFLFVDPPKFIKSRKSYYQGLQGYFSLNRAAVRSLADGGLLFTFSCSHHAGETVFRKKILDAVEKTGCQAREIYHFRQNADHPVLLPMEESFYLKGFLFEIDRRKEETGDSMVLS